MIGCNATTEMSLEVQRPPDDQRAHTTPRPHSAARQGATEPTSRPESPIRCGERLEQQLQSRLLNKAEGVSRESARTYVQRARRLLRNFASWVEDPVKFTPTARRANSVARPTPKGTTMKMHPAPPKNERAIVANSTPPNAEMREHSFQLERGTAVLRIPRAVSLEELRMISLVLASHCPDARFEWPVLRRADEDALAKPYK